MHAECFMNVLLGHAVGGMCDVTVQDHHMGIKTGFACEYITFPKYRIHLRDCSAP